jgi:hypothetical protein
VGGCCEEDGGRCVLWGEEGECEKFEEEREGPATTTGTRQYTIPRTTVDGDGGAILVAKKKEKRERGANEVRPPPPDKRLPPHVGADDCPPSGSQTQGQILMGSSARTGCW